MSLTEENHHSLSSPIFKLNIHCFDELFEYLPLNDLDSLSQTCKTMQQMTCTFFIRNYSSGKFICSNDGIYMINTHNQIPVSGLIQFITSIAIENKYDTCHRDKPNNNDLDKFKYFKLHAKEFKSVKKLSLKNVCLNEERVKYIRKIFPNIEVLVLRNCIIKQDLYDILLKYCKNVRHIELYQVHLKNRFKWLLQKYKKLEHLELFVIDNSDKIDELCTFFELNPDIRSFSCKSFTLNSNQEILFNSKVKLDTLEVKFTGLDWCVNKRFWDLLTQLHIHGFYKYLHINAILRGNSVCNRSEMQFVEKPFLKNLIIGGSADSLEPLSNHLIQFAETTEYFDWLDYGLVSEDSGEIENEFLLQNLLNVERLYLFRGVVDISLFIRKLKNLKKVKLIYERSTCNNDIPNINEIFDLNMLNTERKKLAGAKKVTIYVPDTVFLATKWATRNGTTNFTLIEMKRTNSYEWNRPFVKYRSKRSLAYQTRTEKFIPKVCRIFSNIAKKFG